MLTWFKRHILLVVIIFIIIVGLIVTPIVITEIKKENNKKETKIRLVDNLTFEIGSEVYLEDLIKNINNGELISKNEIIDTSSIGKKEIIFRYLNEDDDEKEYTIQIEIVGMEKPDNAVAGYEELGIYVTDDEIKEISSNTKNTDIEALLFLLDERLLKSLNPNLINEANEYADYMLTSLKEAYDEELLDYIKYYTKYSSIEEYKNSIVAFYLQDKVVIDYIKDSIKKKDIEDYYEKEIVGDIKISHILITPKTNEEMTQEERDKAESIAKTKAEEIIRKLDEADDKKKAFIKLAKEYSDDESTKDSGGSLGYVNKDSISDKELFNVAYKLKINEYTKKPFNSEYGYHIIIKTGEKDKLDLEDCEDDIKTTLANNLLNEDDWLYYKTMVKIRKNYGFKIYDSNLNDKYNDYNNYLN
ncbi:MAG: peptidylprolyl isomerase [Bacilli bacterium]